LAALHEEAVQRTANATLRVALAAPTGKAAQRLEETILDAVAGMEGIVSSTTISALSALKPTTIHRLLGAQGTTGRFHHTASNPLDYDIVIIDETSMVSVPLAARLLDAMRPETRLVLVGDPDQLESVEVGAMLADLVAAQDGVLATRVVHLTDSHRFQGDSPIAVLAAAMQRNDGHEARAVLANADAYDLVEDHMSSTVRFIDTATPDAAPAIAAVRAMFQPSLTSMREAAESGDASGALAALAQARILCAHRRGPAGVARWNTLAEGWMRGSQRGRGLWYPGRPVLITRNDQRLGLSNGDTGVVVRRGDQLEVAFPRAGRDPLMFPTFVLADIETCFAMTVHKSQGSEYTSVAFILPPAASPLIGRELAYTGITRARNHLLVVGSADVLAQCAVTPAERMSGLTSALRVR
jgi:exodeoxyribonuclease V alpha subunit